MPPSRDLLRMTDAVLLPGFAGHTPPEWLRRRLSDGLAGVVLFSRNIADPEQVARLTAALRAENPHVLVGTDEETGEVTRLEVATGSSRPGGYALGVVDDPALTEELARDLGLDLAAVGIGIDFAPSADVNSNPRNPVIGLRAFGADPELVARHTRAFIRGLQSAGVAACAKHFPGHGDASVDSHHGVPVVADGGIEQALRPFRAAIAEGVRAVMTGHLLVPSYDPHLPATLSPKVLTGLLREELGFDGVIVTDGIEMTSVSGPYGIGGAAARALAAGADAICVGGESYDEATIDAMRDAILTAVTEGLLPEERLADAARRVRELALWTTSPGSTDGGSSAGGAEGLRRAEDAEPPSRTGGAGGMGGTGWGGGGIGMVAARRALRVTRRASPPVLPLTDAPHVVELAPETHMAIDKATPWGVAAPLAELLPGTTATRFAAGGATGVAIEDLLARITGRGLVLVVRDAHRHPWQAEALRHLLSARPDAVVVEMGLPHRADLGAVHIATYGAARVCGQAAAEVIAGTPIT
ncbi:glycoside hydrolase family 3 protein [Nonomuraea sp. C10]|uniref:glycoside hydrolase family 3 protein n=1 Tax=Nonomuraea sp. C10 TaxID=2600577 RepID=UPI0011CE3A5C|nr:glycoside hydrolase family 3 N-terminal domain-containing protein [Nonomuraea sp. C10]TXK42836.1 glycoside hydrolase family 3 protein [Nonomuraea sp. C10]